ncbi:histidine kinase [Sphaerisporangium sp. NPDC051011]|uniref:sensor histidine kinase n=1 Tax=Sphaerisporangium sp. NPDC051011 TaxID=3155792 RepID=UPI0033CC8BA0
MRDGEAERRDVPPAPGVVALSHDPVRKWRWQDTLLPTLLAVTQVLVSASPDVSAAVAQVLAPDFSGVTHGTARIVLVTLSTTLACVALVLRRVAPEWALGGILAAALLGIGTGGTAVVWPLAVTLALYSLAVHRTAGVAAAGATATSLVAAVVATAADAALRTVAGITLLVAGAAAMLWVAGRSRRRRRAGRSAVAAYHARASSIPRFAADAERERLAAELHDVAAHRLTGIVVSAAAATRLGDPRLAAEAIGHAADAGRQALTELDRLVASPGPMPPKNTKPPNQTTGLNHTATLNHTEHPSRFTSSNRTAPLNDTPVLADIDVLVARHGRLDYLRTAVAAPPEVGAVAYRVVREALTNAMRYASGASRVRVESTHGGLVVTVTDRGGTAAAPGLGTGNGLAGLCSAVSRLGGSFTAGPAKHGWEVRAHLPYDPIASSPRSAPPPRREHWRGAAALDAALVVLAIALSLGAGLAPGDDPDAFASPLPGLLLATLFALHALPLWWRRNAARRGLTVTLATLVVWLGLDLAGWPGPRISDTFLWSWWVELALLYAIGVHRTGARGWPAPLAVAGVGGLVLAAGDGIHGNRPAVWAVLTTALAIPCVAVWALGMYVAARRRRRGAATAQGRDLLDRDAASAASAERGRIADGLRRTARRHAQNVIEEADAGRLDSVLAEARAGLAALRKLLAELRSVDDGDDPPPTVDGIAALAARRGAVARYVGTRSPLPPAVEVAAYQVAGELLASGDTLTVTFPGEGVTLSSGPMSVDPSLERRLRVLLDACDGRLMTDHDGTIRVWLPETFVP